MEYYIIVYKNTYDAMACEKIFIKNNFEYQIMPTPTSITQSCGICTRITEYKHIEQIITNNLVEYKNIYKKTSEGFVIIK